MAEFSHTVVAIGVTVEPSFVKEQDTGRPPRDQWSAVGRGYADALIIFNTRFVLRHVGLRKSQESP